MEFQVQFKLEVGNIIKGIVQWELSIEQSRIKLAENPNFNILSSFQKLDRCQKDSCLSSEEVQVFLSLNQFAGTPRECEFIVNLNCNEQGWMDIDSLIKTCLPQTDQSLRDNYMERILDMDQKKRKYIANGQMVEEFSEQEVANLFIQEIQFYRKLEKLRQSFCKRYGKSVYQLFRLFDSNNDNSVTYDEIKAFMQQLTVEFSLTEYQALQRRISDDYNSTISQSEFAQLFLPRENYDFPVFTSKFDRNQVYQDLKEKCEAFRLEIGPMDRELNTKCYKNNSNSENMGGLSFRAMVDPFIKGKNVTRYNQHFHREYQEYFKSTIQPSIVPQFYEGGKRESVATCDSHFEDYYKHLCQREKGEQFFNKYAQRYGRLKE